jgi:hypothetical protein
MLALPESELLMSFRSIATAHSNRTPLIAHQNVRNESTGVCYARLVGAPVGRRINPLLLKMLSLSVMMYSVCDFSVGYLRVCFLLRSVSFDQSIEIGVNFIPVELVCTLIVNSLFTPI